MSRTLGFAFEMAFMGQTSTGETRPDIYRGDEARHLQGRRPIDKLVNIIVEKNYLRSDVDKYVTEMFVRVQFFQWIKQRNDRIKANGTNGLKTTERTD